MPTVTSNIDVYLAIAVDAAAESRRLLDRGMTPSPSGQPGHVVAFDPGRGSFKQSLIAIAFAGMYLEALLGRVGRERLGRDLYEKLDRKTSYEEKLRLLGVYDSTLLANCKRFREARNDLVHEKGVDLAALPSKEWRVAQDEAELGLAFVKAAADSLTRATTP